MIIFSNSSILACPDKYDLKKIHIIFNKIGNDYDQLNGLFHKFSLNQVNTVQFNSMSPLAVSPLNGNNWNLLK